MRRFIHITSLSCEDLHLVHLCSLIAFYSNRSCSAYTLTLALLALCQGAGTLSGVILLDGFFHTLGDHRLGVMSLIS